MTEPYDVIIIGGGPAGLACAIYATRARRRTLVLDRSAAVGALAVTSKLANYPGVSGPLAGKDLLDVMRAQATDFGAEYVRGSVTAVDLTSDPKLVYTPDETYAGRTVVVATGALGRETLVPGEEQWLGRGVSHCATCDAPLYIGQEVAVIGDSEVAVEEALFLARFASVVHLVAPRRKLRAQDDLIHAAEANEKIRIHYGLRLREIAGNGGVSRIVVAAADGTETSVAVSGVFIYLTGTAPTTEFLRGALPLTEAGCIATDAEKCTSLPGVYAVGDVTCGGVKQAVVAAADGVVAALSLDKYLSRQSGTMVHREP